MVHKVLHLIVAVHLLTVRLLLIHHFLLLHGHHLLLLLVVLVILIIRLSVQVRRLWSRLGLSGTVRLLLTKLVHINVQAVRHQVSFAAFVSLYLAPLLLCIDVLGAGIRRNSSSRTIVSLELLGALPKLLTVIIHAYNKLLVSNSD